MTAYSPIWVTILPKERRARHPYQLCVMLLLITVGLSQALLGPVQVSTLKYLPSGQAALLSWFCVFAGSAGALSAVIPERIVKVWRWQWDATWWRLILEFAAHALLVFVWAAYLSALLSTTPFIQGLSLGTGAAIWLGTAAVWRCLQIAYTVKRAVWDPPDPSVLMSAHRLDE